MHFGLQIKMVSSKTLGGSHPIKLVEKHKQLGNGQIDYFKPLQRVR